MSSTTTIPQSLQELIIEQAIAREALRLAFEHHKSLAVGLKGVQQERTISDAFAQSRTGATLVNMMALDMLVGSGGCLSHSPRRNQAAIMMIDSFLPEGITRLAVDSIFMMPQLGVLSTLHEKAATEVFEKDCLIHLGTCIAPSGSGKPGVPCLQVSADLPDGGHKEASLNLGDMLLLEAGVGKTVKISIQPHKGFDVGNGSGKPLTAEVSGGVVGVIIDARGRPLSLPEDKPERVRKFQEWHKALGVYPEYSF